MKNKQLAEVYAKAFRDCFTEQKDFYNCVEALSVFYEQILLVKECRVLFSPLFSRKQKKVFLETLMDRALQNNLAKNFLSIVLERSRFSEIGNILTCLEQMQNKMKGIISVTLETTASLGEKQHNQIRKQVEGFFKQRVIMEEQVKKHLLGGVRVKAGGYVFDDSLFFHINQMEYHVRRGFYVQSEGK